MMYIVIAIIVTYILSLRLRFAVYAGLALHAGYVLYRGFTAGRLPILGVYDTLLFMALSIVMFALAFGPFIPNEKKFIPANAIAAALFLLPVVALVPSNNPLPPVLDTYWFEIHVVFSFFGYALFIIGGVLGLIFLNRRDILIERLQYRSILIGYTFFSFAMISGGIWAFYAWGTYWLWTPKEFWTSILWLYYSVYLHTRFQGRLAGRPAAMIGSFGTVVMLFTYLGVGILMESSHSF